MLLEVLTFCKFIYLSRRSQIRFLHRQNGCAIRSFHSADKCFHLLRVAIISRALIGQNGHECAINVYTNVLRHTSKLLWFRRKRFAYNFGPIKSIRRDTSRPTRTYSWEVKYQLSLGFCDRNRGRGSARELKGSGLLDQSRISEFFQLANLASKTATPARQIPKILAIGE